MVALAHTQKRRTATTGTLYDLRKLVQQSPFELVIESLGLRADKAPQQSNVCVAQQNGELTFDERATEVLDPKGRQPEQP